MEAFRKTGIRSRIIFTILISTALPTVVYTVVRGLEDPANMKLHIFLAFLFLLISLISGFLVARSLVNPLDRLRKKIRLFTEKRTITPVKDSGEDEISEISREVDKFFDVWSSEIGNFLKKQKQSVEEHNRLTASQNELEKQIKMTRSCLSIAQKLNTTFDFHTNLKMILDDAVKTMNVQWASILLINRENLEMTVACVRGIEQSLLDDLAEDKYPAIKLKPNEGLAGLVIKTGLPIIANKGFRDPRFKVFSEFKAREEKIGSILCAPIKGTDGTVYGVVNFINRISPPLFRNEDLPFAEDVGVLVSLVVERNKLFKSLFTDETTGLLGHKVWKEYYFEEVARSIRYAHPLSVAILDIDHAKEILEQTSPEFLISVNTEIGRIIKKTLRECDSASRVHDRFYLLLVDTDASGTLFLLGRIKEAVEKASFQFTDKTFSITLSAGIASYPETGPDARQLLDFAQKALENAKSAGRNRAVIYGVNTVDESKT